MISVLPQPATYPQAPARLSVSSLLEIEACPRRWMLGNATYPDVWERDGYPRKPSLSALRGTVVHRALEVVIGALVQEGCDSVRDAKATQVLQQLGGISLVVESAVEESLSRWRSNPRASPTLPQLRTELAVRVPELRATVQSVLAGIQLTRRRETTSRINAPKGQALSEGCYTEVGLETSDGKWLGVADLLRVLPDGAEIVDFKTGRTASEHEFQLHAYAVFWSRDARVNPLGRPATRLALHYPTGRKAIAARNGQALDRFASELEDRRIAALESVALPPGEARPSGDHCRRCHVRHLCSDYWNTAGVGSQVSNGVADLEVLVRQKLGPSSWTCRQLGRATRNEIVLKLASPLLTLNAGSKLRMLNVRVSRSDGSTVDQPVPSVVQETRGTEIFLLD